RLDYVLVVASKERAMRLGEGDYNRRKTDPDTCLSQARSFLRGPLRKPGAPAEDDDASADRPTIEDWHEGLRDQANAYAKSASNPTGGVTAVHSERLVRDASGVRIESLDAWV